MDNWEGAANELKDSGSSLSLCTCRICQTVKSREALISPCNCKGTLGKVHLSCLERWLNICGRQHCEICKFEFSAKRRRRYSVLQSVRIWVRHPRHRILLRSDLIVATILTSVTIALCCICAFGMRYFVIEGLKLGVPSVYTQGVILMFLIVMILGYIVTIYLMAKDHVIPWYRWWTRCLLIKVIVNESNPTIKNEVAETSKSSALTAV
ncbi:E3 ubiquitin-protein ligase MARCH2-like isoform X1 [Cimex lectularius]|uniref:RING-CH-type domain-containing protein n=1 Tax=Cimex lectularius TaxID=79782 RepID=A0A8I6SUV7_CIMLE|nr:E3 ubiquitin-protein ligase MARCH2-like isoform X1 [Cimex lectularius]XP_024084945.1 E3 ubiquitin-protein ligase MARCH2-like isoform X1 [Cimex lectularius]